MAVVSALQGVLGPLLGKLTTLLADECARLKGVRREIYSLRSELLGMHAAIQKYTTLQDPDDQVKQWISLVRELAYDTEDVIDKFVHHLGNGGDHGGGFKEFFRKTARRFKTLGSRRGIANEIDNLKARVKEVKGLKSSYKLDDTVCGTSEHTTVDPRLSALFTEEEHLVGIEDSREDLTNWMMEEDNSSIKRSKVLSIVGFGGLGKTTLANEVYWRIKGHFHCHAFVSVSQKPNVKRIIKDMIKDMTSQEPCEKDFKEDIDTWDEEKCIKKLRELLQDERAAEAAIRKEANSHPNHPKIIIWDDTEAEDDEEEIEKESYTNQDFITYERGVNQNYLHRTILIGFYMQYIYVFSSYMQEYFSRPHVLPLSI